MTDSATLRLSDLNRMLYANTLVLNRSSVAASTRLANSAGPKVFGKVTERAKNTVKWAYNEAKNKVTNYLIRHSLKPYARVLSKDVNVHIERIDPDSGLSQAHTDGYKIGVNEYIVPETNVYSRLMCRLYKHKDRNRFTRYLYDKLSEAYENLKETMKHEFVHVYQIKSGLVDKLVDAAEKYIDNNIKLPEWVKPYKRVLAHKVAIPAIEGLTEATRQEINGYSPQETKIAISRDPTTYAEFTEMAVDALDGEKPSEFQRGCIRDYGRKAGNYISRFLNSMFSKPNYA